jgi:hypothetical protein
MMKFPMSSATPRPLLTMLLAGLLASASISAADAASDTAAAEQHTTGEDTFWSQFMDREDGMLDLSEWLIENAYGFLPVPLIITEPAVDNGLGVAGIFFHKPGKNDRQPEEGEFLLTDISAVAAAYTGNDSWFVGGTHFNTMRKDTIRYTGILGYADINLDFYGSEGSLPGPIEKLAFNGKGIFTDQQIEFRAGESDWFFGGGWRYMSTDIAFDTGFPTIDDFLTGDVTISGLGLTAHYENVNSRMTPTKGFTTKILGMVNDEAIGSDADYEELTWQVRQYFTFADNWLLSWRFDGTTTNGDVPFFLEPFISIEGIPAMRYQGPTAATAEIRGGWEFVPRWSAIAFAGGGRVGDDVSDLGSASSETAYGAGFRYMLAKALGIKVGLDVARGPEDTYVYLVMGSAWSTGL